MPSASFWDGRCTYTCSIRERKGVSPCTHVEACCWGPQCGVRVNTVGVAETRLPTPRWQSAHARIVYLRSPTIGLPAGTASCPAGAALGTFSVLFPCAPYASAICADATARNLETVPSKRSPAHAASRSDQPCRHHGLPWPPRAADRRITGRIEMQHARVTGRTRRRLASRTQSPSGGRPRQRIWHQRKERVEKGLDVQALFE